MQICFEAMQINCKLKFILVPDNSDQWGQHEHEEYRSEHPNQPQKSIIKI